jgi:hypothetical protein
MVSINGDDSLIALMMETVWTSETLVNLYHSTQHYNPEDSHLYTYQHESLKSYCKKSVWYVIEHM